MKRESKVLSVISVVTASLVISACSSSPSTECGAAESIDLVKQMAKTNAVYEKDFLEFKTDKMKRINFERDEQIKECASMWEQQEPFRCAIADEFYGKLEGSNDPYASRQLKVLSFWKERIRPLNLELEKVTEEHKKLVTGNVIYEVSDIITTGKNKELNSATCKASLSGRIDGIGSVKNNITFKLETTSDKKLSATVNF